MHPLRWKACNMTTTPFGLIGRRNREVGGLFLCKQSIIQYATGITDSVAESRTRFTRLKLLLSDFQRIENKQSDTHTTLYGWQHY